MSWLKKVADWANMFCIIGDTETSHPEMSVEFFRREQPIHVGNSRDVPRADFTVYFNACLIGDPKIYSILDVLGRESKNLGR
jgi:hypothetical protein